MRIPIENTGSSPLYVGGKMIPPGETMTFEEEDLPAEHRPGATAEPEETPANPLAEILARSIAKAVLGLPDLSDTELKELELLEMAGGNRKGMLAEIMQETLRRAELAAALKSAPTGEGDATVTDQARSATDEASEA
nr:hypothetical protein [Dechloromonas sp.]